MENYWIELLVIGILIIATISGKLLGLNFSIVITALKEMLTSIKTKSKENKELKKK